MTTEIGIPVKVQILTPCCKTTSHS